nr:gamma-glutamylcyclotransferase family protein [Rhodococcus sp. (in: high G+C Gram-positive bacteria)]
MTPPDGGALLFSYGTLQQREVQIANFGGVLPGEADVLPGHALTVLLITDPDVVALSGTDRHPIVAPSDDPDARVDGTVFALTAEQLAAADTYEVADYARFEVTLGSGRRAWVYLAAAPH